MALEHTVPRSLPDRTDPPLTDPSFFFFMKLNIAPARTAALARPCPARRGVARLANFSERSHQTAAKAGASVKSLDAVAGTGWVWIPPPAPDAPGADLM